MPLSKPKNSVLVVKCTSANSCPSIDTCSTKELRNSLTMHSMSRFPMENSDERAKVAKKNCNNSDTKILLVSYINSLKAGSPTDERIFWVCQRPKEIARKFAQAYQFVVSHGTVKRLFLALGYRFRKQAKELPTGTCANRNLQFQVIAIASAVRTSFKHEFAKANH